LNKNHLYCAKFICIILCTVNLIINIPIFLTNVQNPVYALGFYSLWGTTTALFAHFFSVFAMCYESMFKPAYIATEISYSVNIIVVIVFWLILWPWIVQKTADVESSAELTFVLWYNGLIHSIPFITTVADLYMTDMALEKSHWWIALITLFPCYMIPNWIASM